MQYKEETINTTVKTKQVIYSYKPSKFWLWFWVVFDFIMVVQPFLVKESHRLSWILEISLALFFFFISAIQFLFYYSIEITNLGIGFNFLYKKNFYTWNQLKRIKTYRGRQDKYLYFKVETHGGEIYSFYLPRKDSEKIYSILKEYSH